MVLLFLEPHIYFFHMVLLFLEPHTYFLRECLFYFYSHIFTFSRESHLFVKVCLFYSWANHLFRACPFYLYSHTLTLLEHELFVSIAEHLIFKSFSILFLVLHDIFLRVWPFYVRATHLPFHSKTFLFQEPHT